MDRLKTGEVNLGVRRVSINDHHHYAESDHASINQNVYTDFDNGSPIRRWRRSRCRQPDDYGELHRPSSHNAYAHRAERSHS
jgi:hypothetical protein